MRTRLPRASVSGMRKSKGPHIGLKGLAISLIVIMQLGSIIGLPAVPNVEAAQLGLSTIEVVPRNPNTNDSITIELAGNWPNPCVPSAPVVRVANRVITITTRGLTGVPCTTAVTPWRLSVFVGQLPAGSYQIVVTFLLGGIFPQNIGQANFNVAVFCSYSLSSSRPVVAQGGPGSAMVTAPSGCPWSAVSNSSWITIESGDSGDGNGTVSYSVAANASSFARTGTITIAGRLFPITQAGAAHSGLRLIGGTFSSASGNQRGTGVAFASGGLYLSGNMEPESQSAADAAVVLRYTRPLTSKPSASQSVGSGTNFFGIAATHEGVYAAGHNFSLTSDTKEAKQVKAVVAKFPQGSSLSFGPTGFIWMAGSGGAGNRGSFFVNSGAEAFNAVTAVLESGLSVVYAVGSGDACGASAYIVAKYDGSGSLLRAATDSTVGVRFDQCFVPSMGGSSASAVTTLNGNVYVAGASAWVSEGDMNQKPALWKYGPNLNLLWRRKDGLAGDAPMAGGFLGVAALGNAVYAVGRTFTPGTPKSEDFFIEKYDEAGNVVWRKISGGPGTDVLTSAVGIGNRLFAVGYTDGEGTVGVDTVLLEIDPATGNTLSTTLYSGAKDDFANGVTTDGTDLFIVGASKSVGADNDVLLLQYSLQSGGSTEEASQLALATKRAVTRNRLNQINQPRQGRQRIAQGVSPGSATASTAQAPDGATETAIPRGSVARHGGLTSLGAFPPRALALGYCLPLLCGWGADAYRFSLATLGDKTRLASERTSA